MMSGSCSTRRLPLTEAAISEAHHSDGERRQWCHGATFAVEETDSGDRIERSRLKHVAMSGLYGRNSDKGPGRDVVKGTKND